MTVFFVSPCMSNIGKLAFNFHRNLKHMLYVLLL